MDYLIKKLIKHLNYINHKLSYFLNNINLINAHSNYIYASSQLLVILYFLMIHYIQQLIINHFINLKIKDLLFILKNDLFN